MSISKLVKELRNLADYFRRQNRDYYTAPALSEAADTIESLYAKLQAANMERTGKYRETKDLIDRKELLQYIKEFNFESYNPRKREIECLVKSYICEAINRQPSIAEDCGGWIPCSEPPKHTNEVLIFNGKSYSVGYYDGKTWVNAIHPVEWQEIRHEL